eukprot:NODE_3746_length_747_cov_265.332370.p1 GENE.NODE_3746_length_747_cov_265.332370~~NODE_3746_length_747_cov_265.332370.p1  ORF type:complete len:210 (-),score=68.65 NODE_3746_length_747_cov_265.332370:100-729(-)
MGNAPRATPGVLDYSFLSIESLDELPEKLQFTVGGPPPEDSADDAAAGGRVRKARVNSVTLANNSISQLACLDDALSNVIVDPCTRLRWINLSFNVIVSIGRCFEKFTELTILHLHANRIPELGAIRTLKDLPKLSAVTLHGNPLASQSQYRNFVVYSIPALTKLDFAAVTHQDRDSANCWATMCQKEYRMACRETQTQEHGQGGASPR